MNGYLVVHDGKDRAEWLAARGLGVSATDAARIAGGGAQGWASLRKEKETGSSWRGNASTQHGRDREPVIAAWAKAEFGLEPSAALLGRVDKNDGDYSLDLATPDALGAIAQADGEGLVAGEFGEFKTTVKDWDEWQDVPRRYFWQVVWQFFVTGAELCRFVFEPHVDGVPLYMEPKVFTIARSSVLADIEKAREQVALWRAGSFDAIPDRLLPLDRLLTERVQAKAAADSAAATLAAAESKVREFLEGLGEPVKFEGSEANVTWTGEPSTSRRFDSAAFKARYPAAHARFMTTTKTRPRVTITERS